MKKLKVGDKIKILTPSCSTQPYDISKTLVGNYGTVIWTEDFDNPVMQGICVLVDKNERNEMISAWSYFTGKEFNLVTPTINYCEHCGVNKYLKSDPRTSHYLIPKEGAEERIVSVMDGFWKTKHKGFPVEYAEFPDGGWRVRFHKKDVAQAIIAELEKE